MKEDVYSAHSSIKDAKVSWKQCSIILIQHILLVIKYRRLRNNRTLKRMFESMRKSNIKAVLCLLLDDGRHFHRHSSLVPSLSNVHDNCISTSNSSKFIQACWYSKRQIPSICNFLEQVTYCNIKYIISIFHRILIRRNQSLKHIAYYNISRKFNNGKHKTASLVITPVKC